MINLKINNLPVSVEDGTTISDYSDDEIERKVSINASVLSFKYNKKYPLFIINLLTYILK